MLQHIHTCASCGRPLDREIEMLNPDDLNIQRLQRLVLKRILAGRGNYVSKEQIIFALYGDDPDGEPENAHNVVETVVCKMKHILRPLGWKIDGKRFEGYRLVRLMTAEGVH